MVQRLTAFVDFFLARNTSSGERRVRARMFAFLLLFSIVVVGGPFLAHVISGNSEPRHFLILLPIIIMQLVLLGILRFIKDHEWLCVFMMLGLESLWAIDVAHQQASFLAQGLRIFPLLVIIGLFCVTDVFKRILIVWGVVLAIGLIFVEVDKHSVAYLLAMDRPQIDKMLLRSCFSITLVTLVIVYWYVYLKNLAMRDFELETQLRAQSAKLGEVTSTLRSLVPEFHQPLVKLEDDLLRLWESRSLPEAEVITTMNAQIERMTEVTQSVAWIYRAYRGETVGRTLSKHFAEHLLLLIRGKLHRRGWTAQIDGLTADAFLSGPMPTVLVLILTLIEHVVEVSDRSLAKLLHIEIYCIEQFGCSFAWEHSGQALSLAAVGGEGAEISENNLRLELIAELLDECGAKLSMSSDSVMSLISIAGPWVLSKEVITSKKGLAESLVPHEIAGI